MLNKKVIKTIDSFEFSEIDFDLYEELFTEEKVAEIYNSNEGHPLDYIINEREPECDGEPINIDRLINKLNEFKGKGANYVALEYHCDHIGYILEAIKIGDASLEIINKNEEDILKNKLKQEKIDELKNQIRKIENEE